MYKANIDPGISSKTLYGWMSKANIGRVTTSVAKRNCDTDQSLVEENMQLRKQLRVYLSSKTYIKNARKST